MLVLHDSLCIEWIKDVCNEEGRIHVVYRAKPLVQSRAVGLFATSSHNAVLGKISLTKI